MKYLKEIKKGVINIIFLLLILLTLLAIILSQKHDIAFDDITRMQDKFQLQNDIVIDNTTYNCYTATYTEDIYGKSLLFFTRNSNVIVYIGEKPIYTFKTTSLFNFSEETGTIWNLINLPKDENDINQKITIFVSPSLQTNKPAKLTIYGGTSGELIYFRLHREIPDILANIILLFMGITLCVIYGMEYKNHIAAKQTLALGLMAIFITTWTISDLFIFQIVLPTSVGQYYIYYISYYLAVLSALVYIEETTHINSTIELILMNLIAILLVICQISGACSFTKTMPIYVCLMAIAFTIDAIKIKLKHYKFSDNPMIITSLIMLILGIITTIVIFIFNRKEEITLLPVKAGFAIYMIVKTTEAIIHLINELSTAKDTERIIKIAYTDALTGIPNRKAYERDLQDLPIQNLGIVSFDVNNLKYYNDKFGHVKGDQFLIAACEMLKSIYGEALYRTGGDEFVAVLYGMTEDAQANLRTVLQDTMTKYNSEDHEFILEIASGDGRYRTDDETYEDIFKRADKAMYENKEYLKMHSKVPSMR